VLNILGRPVSRTRKIAFLLGIKEHSRNAIRPTISFGDGLLLPYTTGRQDRRLAVPATNVNGPRGKHQRMNALKIKLSPDALVPWEGGGEI